MLKTRSKEPRMLWIHPANLAEGHLRLLVQALDRPPAYEQLNKFEVLHRLHHNEAHMFAFPGGLIVTEVRVGEDGSRRLSIIAFAGKLAIWRRKELAEGLRKIAAENACDMIETCVFDRRLARAIESVGGVIESFNLVLPVEG